MKKEVSHRPFSTQFLSCGKKETSFPEDLVLSRNFIENCNVKKGALWHSLLRISWNACQMCHCLSNYFTLSQSQFLCNFSGMSEAVTGAGIRSHQEQSETEGENNEIPARTMITKVYPTEEPARLGWTRSLFHIEQCCSTIAQIMLCKWAIYSITFRNPQQS